MSSLLARIFGALSLLVGAALAGTALPVSARADLPALSPARECAALMLIDFGPVDAEVPFRLHSAVVVDLAPVGSSTAKAVCQVKGYAFPAVNFEIRLPVAGWTQRLLMFGCGGYCGIVAMPGTAASTYTSAWNCPLVTSGEMVVATHDGGHTRTLAPTTATTPGIADGAWARDNPQGMVDFAHAALHKATVATKAVTQAYYGQAQRYAYYTGCSDGGRQGLQSVQRYPADFDGVLAGANTLDVVETNTFYHAWNVRVNAAAAVPGTAPVQYRPILTANKIPALRAAVLRACGRFAGGLADMVQDPRACTLDARTLVCSGAETDACLSAAQAEAVNRIWQGPVDETGARMIAGDMPYGSEQAWIGTMVPAGNAPIALHTTSDYQWSYDFPHYMARFGAPQAIDVNNIAFTRAQFDQLTVLSPLYTATNPDIRPFIQRGGKLLMYHGYADPGSTFWHSLNYYTKLREFVGASAADAAVALYMIPGVYHCNAGPEAASQDFLSPLVDWVEQGSAPGKVAINHYPGPSRDLAPAKVRPVWPYPAIARWNGSGDAALESSFVRDLPSARLPDSSDWLGLRQYAPGKQMHCAMSEGRMVCRIGNMP